MCFNIDQFKKKIIYRANYSGNKEMDKLQGALVSKYLNDLTKNDLIELEKLLDIDDTNLYNFYNGLETDVEFKTSNINTLFKNFKYRE